MTALWTDGIAIFDIGGGGKGGTAANPVQLGSTTIVGGKAHNIFWYRDPSNGSKRFAMVGEEVECLAALRSRHANNLIRHQARDE